MRGGGMKKVKTHSPIHSLTQPWRKHLILLNFKKNKSMWYDTAIVVTFVVGRAHTCASLSSAGSASESGLTKGNCPEW